MDNGQWATHHNLRSQLLKRPGSHKSVKHGTCNMQHATHHNLRSQLLKPINGPAGDGQEVQMSR